MAIRKGFKKYEYEDIRTDYAKLVYTNADSKEVESQFAGLSGKDIKAGTVIKVAKSTTAVTVSEASANDLTSANINKTVFLLSEDLKVGDYGFVYYIVEDINNLEDRA
jgi:hypothetical protein